MELFFGFLFEIFEKITMSAKTIFAGDRIFEKKSFEWRQSECHVTTKENKEGDSREISAGVPHRSQADDSVKSELAQNDGNIESEDIDKKDGFFDDSFVGVKDKGNKKDEDQETHKFGAKIVGIFAVIVAVVKSPKQGRSDGNFDMLPSGFVDGGKQPYGALLAGEIVEKMGQSAHGGDGDDANPYDESIVHGDIIA